MSRKIMSPHFNNLVERYKLGESVKALSEEFGMTRDLVRRELVKLGIEPRGRSDAMYTRMYRTSSEERSRLTTAAREAKRGNADTPESKLQRKITRATHTFSIYSRSAKTYESRLSRKIGVGETILKEWLEKRGLNAVHQQAVGIYNIDLGIKPIAVEIMTIGSYPLLMHKYAERTVYLADCGWSTVFVWVTGSYMLTEAAADYIVARYKEVCSDPAEVCKYRVVRGTGEDSTRLGGNVDKIPEELSAIRAYGYTHRFH